MRGIDSLHVLDEYWMPSSVAGTSVDGCLDIAVRTEVGCLIHKAKDLADPSAAFRLGRLFASLAARIPVPSAGPPNLVTAVPSGSAAAVRDGPPTGPRTVATQLAQALARAGVGEWYPGLIGRHRDMPKMRDVAPALHDEVAAGLGYRALQPVAERHVVLVDDVMLTGATLRAVAQCLRNAGAASVTAAVAARTRRMATTTVG